MKKTFLALTLIVTILVLTTIAALFVVKPSPFSFDNSDQKTLFIASFSPENSGHGRYVTGGRIVLVNPTNKNFENLTLTVTIDNSELIVPSLRFRMRLPIGVEPPIDNAEALVTQINSEPYQNETIRFFLFETDQNESYYYGTNVNVQTFSSHVFRFYITQNVFGEIINGQSFTIPREKVYLQITGYSSIVHDNNTWNEYFNSATNRFEYINDQPNFYQQYHYSRYYYPMDPSSYDWGKTLNQMGEHYFNVTILNNCSFPVNGIGLFDGLADIGVGFEAFALPDEILQPDEIYTFPVPVGGENWWIVDSVYQLSSFFPAYAFATDDLISS